MRALQKSASLYRAVFTKPLVENRLCRWITTAERDKIRAKYQAPGHDPIWMRGGPADKALFGLTVTLASIGVLHTFYRFYQRA